MSTQQQAVGIYAIRTVSGQEINVALMLRTRIQEQKIPVYSIVVSDSVKGIVFLETNFPHIIDSLVYGIKHVRGKIKGKVKFDELINFIIPKPVIEELDIGDTVEIISGPYRGMKAKVVGLDKPSNKVRLELLESPYPLVITLKADALRLVSKESKK